MSTAMTRLSVIATKLIYGLFIVWLGLLAPLVYFDRFAINHHIQPYRFALFETGRRMSGLPPAALAPQLLQQLKQRLTRQHDVLTTTNPVVSLARSLQWSVDQLYLVAGAPGLLFLTFGRLGLVEHLLAASADLPRPKKPPRLTYPH